MKPKSSPTAMQWFLVISTVTLTGFVIVVGTITKELNLTIIVTPLMGILGVIVAAMVRKDGDDE